VTTKSSFYTNGSNVGSVINPAANSSFYITQTTQAAIDASVAAAQAAQETGFGLGIAIPGAALTSSEWLFGHKFDIAVNFALNLSGSQATAGVGATGSPVLSIKKNGVQFATLTYSGTTGTFSGSATSFAIGDLLEVVAPASPDATLARLSITLFGVRP
jgi:hypothetical protein